MSTPPTGAPAGAPVGAPAGGSSAPRTSYDVVPGQVVQTEDAADVIAETVLATPGVAGLHGGPFGTVATYLPGRRVSGVAIRSDNSWDTTAELVEISIIAAADRGLRTNLPALAARVRAAVTPLVQGPVRVTISDLAEPTA